MRVLAIGATEFIGPHVVRSLVAAGHDVAVLHRSQAGPGVPAPAREITGDRNRAGTCRAAMARFAPDAVVDFILYTEQQARDLVDAVRGRIARLVVLSSADVYRNYDGLRGKATAPPDRGPLTEDTPLRESRYPYRGHQDGFAYAHDYEKVLVERALRGHADLPVTALRLPAVYGPGDAQHRLRPYLQQMTPTRTEYRLDEKRAGWRWTRGFVANVATAIALAVTDVRGGSRVYNVGDEPTLTEREWVQRVAAAAGWGGDVVAVPTGELPDQLRQPMDWRYELWTDSMSIRSELGYSQPVALDDALDRAVAWERAQRTHRTQ